MNYDIIVIGGGNAGIEAAYIAAQKHLSILLITNQIELIGHMSCNPAIGGIAKGNIVREIDALGGLMASIIDKTGIHFKMLNRSKGTAVWGNRAQADKEKYRIEVRKSLERQKNIFLLQGMVVRIETKGSSVAGVILDSGQKIEAKAVIITTGTFLNGIAHIGLNSFPCGRIGEPPSLCLTESINDLGITSGRLKTGTSPRLDGRKIDYSKFEEQKGDVLPWMFSFDENKKIKNRVSCWIGKTNSITHKIILENLEYSPLYSGKIKSIGPRYCPSIEDKIVRFGERDGHTLFLEPETLNYQEVYLNGLATSLPFSVQYDLIRSIPGLEDVAILRPGYAIEYDYFHPQQLKRTLESKKIDNLFFAGQINGTSGYEEAAGQGIVAGINAVQKILKEEELVLLRDSSYIGVLIDDLITKGTDEPYRMFTSRAEHRILLRQDNSDERLLPIAVSLGFVRSQRYNERKKVWEQKRVLLNKLRSIKVQVGDTEKVNKIAASVYLKRPNVTIYDINQMITDKIIDNQYIITSVESDIKYEGFIKKEINSISQMKKLENTEIPKDFDYTHVSGLLKESRENLIHIKPITLGQAARIPGITPADVTTLAIYILNHHHTVSRETMGSCI